MRSYHRALTNRRAVLKTGTAFCRRSRSVVSQPRHQLRATQAEDSTIQSTQQGQRNEDAPSTSLPSDPVELIAWGGRQPSRRRLLLGSTAALTMALGANFCGVTSALLSIDGGNFAQRSRMDMLVPVNGLKRCADYNNLYEFQYPAQWVADQTIARLAARQVEQDHPLDPPSPEEIRARANLRKTMPVAAFGPPGTSGEENISIIVAPIYPGFNLTSLGAPKEQAAWFLSNVAPETSNRRASLIDARERQSTDSQLYYQMEYIISSPTFVRHNVAVYTARDDLLYTFSAQCPETDWERDANMLRKAADSFRLMTRS